MMNPWSKNSKDFLFFKTKYLPYFGLRKSEIKLKQHQRTFDVYLNKGKELSPWLHLVMGNIYIMIE
mgnify:CR=1 FL=1